MKHLLIYSILITMNSLQAQTFTLKSNDLSGQITQKQFGSGFGCTGDNLSPELHWENAPKETKAFAITMHDLDAPTGSGFWHWVVYNIPSTITSLKADAGNFSGMNLPKGSSNGNNDAGAPGYVGPCPPAGQNHRYVITLYALADQLQLDKNASAALIGFMLNANPLAKASIIAYGKR